MLYKRSRSRTTLPRWTHQMAQIVLAINGEEYQVPPDIGADTSLNVFIRDHAHLRGTKAMCHEGGCGACIVSVKSRHPVTKKMKNYAVNSCLVSILSCHGWEITTVEGLGDKSRGYHEVQKRLAEFNGTQCGYCSPGMVMNMNSLLENNINLTMKEVENSFGGNICRCTGYRPILDAFKSLCIDADPDLMQKCQDIEEMGNIKACPKTGRSCSGSCLGQLRKELSFKTKNSMWYKVDTVQGILNILREIGDVPYMLVAGNTANGVYRITTTPEVYIDVSSVAELKRHLINSNIVLGGGVTLTEAMEYLTTASELQQFAYAKELVHHIDLIANVPVRNIGTLAGNLAIKHQRKEFPSDIFLILETVGAKLTIVDVYGGRVSVTPAAFLDLDMQNKVIASISLPAITGRYALKTYKIMPRAQNAHAYVNAGFYVKFTNGSWGTVEHASIVFGGINPDFIHASKTERSLRGMNLFDSVVLKSTFNSLNTELCPDWELPDATPEYRKNLALSLFYKFVLNSCPPELLSPTFQSGGEILSREVSSGKQSYETNKNSWPLTQPLRKVEAVAQCSGEAQYVNDLPAIPGELYAALVLARTRPLTNIVDIDPSEALKIPGVKAFFSANDIPGLNTFLTTKLLFITYEEEIFASKKVLYNGQPIGIITATTQKLALKAAKLVKVEYEDTGEEPMYSVRSIIAKGSNKIQELKFVEIVGEEKGSDIVHSLQGSMDMGAQYHYYMETQSCVCVPTDDGMDIYPASQWIDGVHVAVSDALNILQSRINVNIRRVGGGYGGKISRANLVATACAVAAHLLNKPVRLVLSLEDNMDAIGKRYGCYFDYDVSVDANGKIQTLSSKYYHDFGCSLNEVMGMFIRETLIGLYDDKSWDFQGFSVSTDVASNTWCRAPGSTEGSAMIENIMEHIAFVTGIDPLTVRLNNLPEDSAMRELIEKFREDIDYDSRKANVEEFNKENRWRKRGMALLPLKYSFGYYANFSATVSIYHGDGTVAVSHAGIECGQGINTKVAQVCAYTLGVPVENVIIKATNVFTAPNSFITGGSTASDSCCFAVMHACRELMDRLEPIKSEMEDPTWMELITKAYTSMVDLSAKFMVSPMTEGIKPYIVWGLSAAEVEVDLLTGNILLHRVDILEDTGDSISPEIDVGQIEGAFVMGLGYWLNEQIMFDEETGALLNNRTWTYKPPGVKDIPVDFRIQFYRNGDDSGGFLRAKTTGEAASCMAFVAVCALRHALYSARSDANPNNTEWFNLGAPSTAEHVFLSAQNNYKQYTLKGTNL